MTAKQLLNGVIIELNKLQAPSLLLEDFNYFANKAINLYINKRYSQGYDVNQQFTDDVRVLKSSAVLYAEDKPVSNDVTSLNSYLNDAKYTFNLPADYLHLLNCSCIYEVRKRYNCYNPGTYWEVGATRLTADIAPVILNNWYMRPSYKKPYYYINNKNIDTNGWDEEQELTPTNPIKLVKKDQENVEDNSITGILGNNGTDRLKGNPDINGPMESHKKYYHIKYDDNEKLYEKTDGTFSSGTIGAKIYENPDLTLEDRENEVRTEIITKDISLDNRVSIDSNEYIDLRNLNFPRFRKERDGLLDDTVERTAGNRYGNASKVRLEIRYGKDNSVFKLAAIKVDYIKAPQHIRLTQEQMDLTEDTSQILEFPDYVCQEIINELVHLIMENASDPRIQSHPVVTLSIAPPAQGLTQQSKK